MIRLDDLFKFALNEKELFPNGVFKRSDVLLKVRLLVFSVAFIHLSSVASYLLNIDFTTANDPALWVYANVRWKLITCWFNLLSMAYLPMCVYCDWKELRKENNEGHVKHLNRIRFTLFTSILLPTTIFADILFWRLWNKDRELVAPVSVDAIVPFWSQHSMHTVSLVVVLLDLILVPRKRPRSLMPGLTIMMLFVTVYTYVCADSYLKGEYLYPVFKYFNGFKFFILYVYVNFEHLLYFVGQFFIIEFLWGRNNVYLAKTKSIH